MFESDNADEAAKDDEADKDDPVAQYNALKAQVEQYKGMIEQFDIKIDTLTKDTEALQKELDAAVKEYNQQEAALIKGNKHIEQTMNDIESTKGDMEDDIATQQKRAVWDAINSYDPEKDGDWEEYLEKSCEGSIYSGLGSKLNSLISESKISMAEVKGIASELSKMSSNIGALSDRITNNTSMISSLTSMKETTQVALDKAQEDLNNSILNFVSCEEMALVTDNNIDLKETLPDGGPRYIFAKGKQDGQYHIYDMAEGKDGASLARQYGCDGCDSGGLRGSNIVPSGNGYIYTGLTDVGEGQGEEVFWLTDCGMQSKNCCYDTCSPLEFDLEGDGHKLDTSKTVQYDIDGDGKLDNINDSLDAVLVFDKDGDGISGEDGSEAFGNNTDLDNENGADGYKNGFEALGALRDKAIKEGVLKDRGDNTLNAEDLKALEENYGLKIKTGGYNSDAQSLEDVGITEIKLSDEKVSDKTQFDSFGNEIQTQKGATFKINGKENTYADLWHRKYTDSEASSLSSSLSFDINTAASLAINAKINANTKTASLLAQTSSNESDLSMTSLTAKKDVNKALNENFWKGTVEPENFFTQSTNENTQEVEEAEEEIIEEEIEEEEK